jgi:O-acetyl-ADP-ribose deacetylase (regulator of RNase III)
MPIVSEVKGDIVKLALAGKYKAIVQGCNCLCVMGSGLAPQIKKAWPEVYEADCKTERGDRSKLGKFTSHHDTEVDVRIFNLYTQFAFDRIKGKHDVDYEAVAMVFKRLNTVIPSIERNAWRCDDRKVGIPMIGSDLAGGHWQAIKVIIDLVTPNLDIELVIYQP